MTSTQVLEMYLLCVLFCQMEGYVMQHYLLFSVFFGLASESYFCLYVISNLMWLKTIRTCLNPVEFLHLLAKLWPRHLWDSATSILLLCLFFNDLWHLKTAILHVTFGKEMLFDPGVVIEDWCMCFSLLTYPFIYTFVIALFFRLLFL